MQKCKLKTSQEHCMFLEHVVDSGRFWLNFTANYISNVQKFVSSKLDRVFWVLFPFVKFLMAMTLWYS